MLLWRLLSSRLYPNTIVRILAAVKSNRKKIILKNGHRIFIATNGNSTLLFIPVSTSIGYTFPLLFCRSGARAVLCRRPVAITSRNTVCYYPSDIRSVYCIGIRSNIYSTAESQPSLFNSDNKQNTVERLCYAVQRQSVGAATNAPPHLVCIPHYCPAMPYNKKGW